MKTKKESHQNSLFPMLLNKFLSHAGVCSRRQAVEYIKSGQVTVNGEVVEAPWQNVKAGDRVLCNGRLVVPDNKLYILLNKPKDCVTTLRDEAGRRTVVDIVSGATTKRIYPVGRLDRDTTGLILMTNDGELTQRLAHPKNDVKKVYHVVLDRPLDFKDLQQIREGVKLKDGRITVDVAGYVLGKRKNHVKLHLHSGKKRVVRRIFQSLGYHVAKLDRINFAGLTKRGLSLSKWRLLTNTEITALKTSGSVEVSIMDQRKKSGRTREAYSRTKKSNSRSRDDHSKNRKSRTSKTRR